MWVGGGGGTGGGARGRVCVGVGRGRRSWACGWVDGWAGLAPAVVKVGGGREGGHAPVAGKLPKSPLPPPVTGACPESPKHLCWGLLQSVGVLLLHKVWIPLPPLRFGV